MLGAMDATLLRSAIAEAEAQLTTLLEQVTSAVRVDSAAGVDAAQVVHTGLEPLRKAVAQLSSASELELASRYGDAFALTSQLPDGSYEVPDRVKAAPLLAYYLHLFPGETDAAHAAEQAQVHFSRCEPRLVRGRLEGMKELVCVAMQKAYLDVTRA